MRILTPEGDYARVKVTGSFLTGSEVLSAPQSPISFISRSDGTPVRRNYEDVYLSNPWLFAVFNMKSNGAARMPSKVYRESEVEVTDDDGNKRTRIKRERIRPRGAMLPDPKERRAKSLAQALYRPGNGVSAAALRRSTMINRLTWGPAVWVIERNGNGDYLGFTRIPFRHLNRDTLLGVVRYWDNRRPAQKYLQDDIVQFGRGSDCYELDTPSPIGSLHATLALYDAVRRYTIGYFRNSAQPSGHYKIPPELGKTGRQLVRQALTELYAGPDNAGKVLVTSAGWESHGDAGIDHNRVIELAKQSRDEIVSAYNMPPPMVGILDRAIMSNVRELRSHYARDVVGPDMELLEGDIDAQIIATDDLLSADVYHKFELANITRADPEGRQDHFAQRLLIESPNELRDSEDMDPIEHPSADLPWLPSNTAPLGQPTDPSATAQRPTDPPLFERPPKENDE